MCATHGRQIDGDESTFTVDELRRWKAEREAAAKQALGKQAAELPVTERVRPPLLVLRPDVMAEGEPAGHFLTFTIENLGLGAATNVKVAIVGTGYDWRPDGFPHSGIILREGEARSIRYPLSEQTPFKQPVESLRFRVDYKTPDGVPCHSDYDLKQKLVPSRAFYQIDVGDRAR